LPATPNRPAWTPGTNLGPGPETRQYQAQYLDGDDLVGPLSDVLLVTVPERQHTALGRLSVDIHENVIDIPEPTAKASRTAPTNP
jgi:hypothetical protein